jgi:hypothetical protein
MLAIGGLLTLAACGGAGAPPGSESASLLGGPAWPEWGQGASHRGALPVAGQALRSIYLNYTYDPLVPDETANNFGGLLAHYMTPLTESDAVYMEEKGGVYSPDTYATQKWGVVKFKWVGGQLVKQWETWTDWKAPGSQNDFWEPVFHGALANGYLYVPGGSGSVLKLDKATGAVVSRISPVGNNDPNSYMVSPITVDKNGYLFVNVIKMTGESRSVAVAADESFTAPRSAKNWHAPRVSNFYGKDVVDSWLARIAPDDSLKTVSYSKLTVGAPAAGDQCLTAFSSNDLPWPPSRDAVPPSVKCGTQRAAVAAAPAVADDGTIYVITRSHVVSRYGYLIAVNPNLTLKWSASLRERLADGCGVPFANGGSLPPNGAPGGCRAGANDNVDPATNRTPGGRVLDDSSSSPTVAPDGSIYYGAYTRYNFDQGHLMRFDANGNFLGAYGFGWDTTAAVWQHDGTFSVVTKDNHYEAVGSYCDDEGWCPSDRNANAPDYPVVYGISQFTPDLKLEWQYVAQNKQTCHRDGNGAVSCADLDDHPYAFEWCVNAPAIDSDGTVFVNSEDGWLYAIAQGGAVRDRIFEQDTLGAAYTPASLGTDGKIYSQNSGHLFVVGQ